jgi:hypothetical protein
VQKKQNRVSEYKEAFEELHRHGILTFTGLMFALEEDTVEYYADLPRRLDDVGTCVILPSISVPIYGTPWHKHVEAEGRITDTDIRHYEGDHVVFSHPRMSDAEIFEAYERVNSIFFSTKKIIARWWKFMKLQRKQESLGQFILKLLVTTFVYYKLSIFQRDHAEVKVIGKNRGKAKEPVRETAPRVQWAPTPAVAMPCASAAVESWIG